MLRSKSSRPKSGAAPPGAVARISQPTLYDKLVMLDHFHANGKNQTHTAQWFKTRGFPKLSQSTLSRLVRDEAELRRRATNARMLSVVRVRPVANWLFDQALGL